MSDAPPVIPPEFQNYNSYKIDPIYQRKLTVIWASVSALFMLAAFPRFIWSLRTGHARYAFTGLLKGDNIYKPIDAGAGRDASPPRKDVFWKLYTMLSLFKTSIMWTISLLGLDVGQLFLVIGYYVSVLICSTVKSELIDNPNRPGFIAVAQLPPVFLLAMKNSPLSILLSSGYEKLNFLHRWCSRATLLCAAIHSFLWMWRRYSFGLPIVGKRKDVIGIIALALLCALGFTSIRPVRARAFQSFRVIHLLAVPAFGLALHYHTKRANPYLYPSFAFWGLDLILRAIRFRMRTGLFIALDTQMTIIRIPDCASGWSPGQHVRLRVFFAHRMFESHALTIINAPQSTTCLEEIGLNNELLLGAGVNGDWSRALNARAHGSNVSLTAGAGGSHNNSAKSSRVSIDSESIDEEYGTIRLSDLSIRSESDKATDTLLRHSSGWSPADQGVPLRVMLDGPYGGSPLDLGLFERVLLIAGGTGVTFTLGLLDDLVGRCLKLGRPNREMTQRVEFVWCVRSISAVDWVLPLLTTISSRASTPNSTLDLHVSIYVTRINASEEDETPLVQNCDITFERPSIRRLVGEFASSEAREDTESANCKWPSPSDWESLAICAAGPPELTNDVRNSAARLALRNLCKRIDCHTEVYFL